MKYYLLLILLGLGLTFSTNAEQKKQLGNWDVHYIAFPAPMLTPEIAQHYKLQRSKYNGIVNISVLDNTTQKPQQVTISGVAKDVQQRQRTLEFSEVTEGNAVYYLAQIPFQDAQLFRFSIEITNGEESQLLTFEQTFYVD